MNCTELERSLAEITDGSGKEQQVHLKTCAACSDLLADLNTITFQAAELRATDEPSPRVWNSIEIALRREGLIRTPGTQRPRIASFSARWGWSRWLVPAAAALLFAVGIYLKPKSAGPETAEIAPPAAAEPYGGMNDSELLQEVSERSPVMKAQYEDNLRHANDYIRDAQSTVDSNPNDEDARRSLMEAYEQKAMLFEMAADRSLP
jgi:hypothetical protein